MYALHSCSAMYLCTHRHSLQTPLVVCYSILVFYCHCLLLLVLGPMPFYQALQPTARLHTMLVAPMQLSELRVRPLLARTRQRHRYVHIRVCLFCTGIAALLYSYQALQLASCVMRASQAPSAQLSYRDSPFSADVRRSVCLHLLIRSLTADQPSDCSPAGALTACQPQGRTQQAHVGHVVGCQER